MFDMEKIRATAERVAASHQLEVVDLECLGTAKEPVLRVFIEKNSTERARLREEQMRRHNAEGAEEPRALDQLAWITHEDCETFSRDFGAVIEVEDTTPDQEYLLEISSPGLNRKLRGIEDYHRFRGSLVKIETVTPVAGNRNWRGRLTDVRDGRVQINPSSNEKRKRSRRKRDTATSHEGEHPVLEIALANILRANLVPEF